MAKSVTFTIDLVVNGKKMVVSATTDAKKFARELGITKTKADELRSSLLNFNQAVLAFQNLGNSLRQVIGIMNDYSSAYAVQQEAETKLANNMRNTMNAREGSSRGDRYLSHSSRHTQVPVPLTSFKC